MERRARILTLTAGLAAAGAILGALASVAALAAAFTVIALIKDRHLPSLHGAEFAYAAGVGGALGIVLGPAAAWLLLRDVPLGRALGGATIGTLLGAFAFVALPVGPIPGALLGFAAACVWLRRRGRAKARTIAPSSDQPRM
ncbi:MAG: hypothetical protein ABJF01_12615 [bacterium]